jgi:mono/diheme cytochrome c family protein
MTLKQEAMRSMAFFQQVTGSCAALVVAGVLLAPTFAAAAQFDRGQALYENHCRSCHEDWAHDREDRQVVGSLDALRARVAAWSIHSGLDWSAEEVDDVTGYLNRRFYHLSK